MAQRPDASPSARMNGRTQRSQTDLFNSFPSTRPTSTSVTRPFPSGTEMSPESGHANVVTNSEQDTDMPYDYAVPYEHFAISQTINKPHEGDKVLYEDVNNVENNIRNDKDLSPLRNQFLCQPTVNPAYGVPNCVA